MIPILFAVLIVLAALYVILPLVTGEELIEERADAARKKEDLSDQIESARLSLRDLDFEHKIGRISDEDFAMLKKELLVEWSDAEETLKNTAAQEPATAEIKKTDQASDNDTGSKTDVKTNCPECNFKIANPGKDRFCAACGAKLLQMLMAVGAGLLLFFSSMLPQASLDALDLTVKITNATKNRPAQKADRLIIRKLFEGMTEVKNISPADAITVHENLEEFEGDYLVQADYLGVRYSAQVAAKGKKATLEVPVYETTSTFSADIASTGITVLIYTTDGLVINQMFNFNNKTNYTFSEQENGIYIKLPQGAANPRAAVEIGGADAQVRWLPLQVTESKMKQGYHVLPYALKPGSRAFQVTYILEYQGDEAVLDLGSPYKTVLPMRFIKRNPGMKIELKTGGTFQTMQTRFEKDLEEEVLLPEKNQLVYTLKVTGGSALQTETRAGQNEEQEKVKVKASISIPMKLVYVALSVFILSGAFILVQKNKSFMNRARSNHLAKLQIRRELLKKTIEHTSEDDTIKLKKYGRELSEIESKIKKLESYLDRANG